MKLVTTTFAVLLTLTAAATTSAQAQGMPAAQKCKGTGNCTGTDKQTASAPDQLNLPPAGDVQNILIGAAPLIAASTVVAIAAGNGDSTTSTNSTNSTNNQ